MSWKTIDEAQVEIQRRFNARRRVILQLRKVLSQESEKETDEFKKNAIETFNDMAGWIDDLFLQMKYLYKIAAGHQKQITILKTSILSLPEVQRNPELAGSIEKMFKDYQENQ